MSYIILKKKTSRMMKVNWFIC